MKAKIIFSFCRKFLIALLLAGLITTQSLPAIPVRALATLGVTPVTWNIIGLDSNNVNVGPNHFPIGARVCNTSATDTATNVKSAFVFDDGLDAYTGNTYINLRGGTLSAHTANGITLAPGACTDFYYEIEVARNSNAYNKTRRYHITASSDAGAVTGSTPVPRELFVEHLVSQSRNAVTDVQLDGVSIPPGGSMSLVVGNTYTIKLIGFTATQGYNQLESFINFPNTIFQVLSVTSTYTAGTSLTDKLYADACGWDNVLSSPTYRSCIVSDNKSGGDVTATYQVKILQVPGAPLVNPEPLSTLLYDFSGSSYHYNSDYGISQRFAQVIEPTASVNLAKSFSPATIPPGGTSTLTFTLTNSAAITLSSVNFTDNLPILSGNQLVVATPATYSSSGCGSAPTLSFTPAAGANNISVSGVTIAPNGSCTLNVSVSAPSGTPNGTFANTTQHLFVGSADSNKTASANLTVDSASGSAGTGLCNLTLASWTFAGVSSGALTSPYTANTNNVTTASMTWGNGLSMEGDTTSGGGNPQPGGLSYGWQKNGPIDTATSAYIQFAVNTSQYTGVKLRFDAQRKANGPNNDELYYSTNGTTWTSKSTFTSTTGWASYPSASTYYDFTGQTSTGGITYFRIYGYGANATSSGNDLTVDNVGFTGCATPLPPTLTKTFNTNPVAVNGTSTLTFTITNPNSAALSGIQFTDVLPVGLSISDSGPTTVCGGALTTTAATRTITFTGGSLSASSSCAITTPAITATTAGPHPNVSGFIASTESGTNSTATGSAKASLVAVLPPQIEKVFSPNPIISGAVSTLTFIITNPNPSDALPNVTFTDTFPNTGSSAPGNMVTAASPGVTTSGCGSPVISAPIGVGTVNAGVGSFGFVGGTIAAGGTCMIKVNVTASATGDYTNTTSAVTTTIGSITSGTDIASSTLTVNAPNPGLVLSKKVSTSNAGPWRSFVTVTPGNPIYYQFTLENIGDVPLDLVAPVINDPLVSTASCTWPATLPVASSTTDPTASCIISVTAAADDHPNTATATAYYGSTPYRSTSSADYFGSATGQLNLSKQVSTSASGPWSATLSNVTPGSNLYYRFTVINLTGLQLSNLILTDPAIDVSSCALTDPLAANGVTSCVVGPVTAATSGASHTNTAQVTGDNGGTPYSSPNSTASYTLAVPSLTLAKTNNNATVTAGGTTTYALTVSNTGSLATSGTITVVDVLPTGLSVTTGAVTLGGTNAANWSCSADATESIITCTSTLSILTGGSSVFNFVASVAAGAIGNLTNTAQVGGGGDPATSTPDATSAGSCTGTDTPTKGCAVDTDAVTANAVPLAVADATTATAGVAKNIDVLVNDTQLGDAPTGITTVSTPTKGTATLNNNGTPSDPTDDYIIYVPAIAATGTDSFNYTICDSTIPPDCSTAVVNITINAVPVAVDDNTTATAGAAKTVNVLANDTQLGDTPTSPTAVSTPGKGTATINDNGTPADPTDDTITYTPAITASGTDTFTYTICDSTTPVHDCSTATVTVTINSVPIAVSDNAAATAGVAKNVNVLANDVQLGDIPTSITSVSTPSQGTAILNNNGTPSDPTDDYIVYTPNADATGSDTFTYTICDNTTPSPDCSTATVAISLSAVPVAVNDSTTATAGVAENIDVLANDTQLGDGPTSITSVSTPGKGTATLNNNGTPLDPTDDFIVYTPNVSATGTDTFTYTICDSTTPTADCSTATVTITLDAVPQPVDDGPINLVSNSTNNRIAVLTNDSFGANGPAVSAITITVLPANGTATVDDNGTPTDPTDDTLLYTPTAGYAGSDSLTYQICDIDGDCRTAVVSLNMASNPGTVGGLVFNDLNANGLQNAGELPISGVTVELFNSLGVSLGTQVTAANGTYSFTNIPAGDYTVIETDQNGYISTTPNLMSVTVVLGTPATVNFGDLALAQTILSSIGGTVFDDANDNCVFDSGESVLANVSVVLLDGNGNPVSSTLTSASGIYHFSNLPAGLYLVTETDPSGYISTTLNTVGVALGSGAGMVVNYGDRLGGAPLIIDPAATKFGDPIRAQVGDLVTYTITVGNTGTGNATNVVVTDTKPDFLDIIAVNIFPASSFPTTISGNTLTINFGTIAPTDLYIVTVTTRVNALGRPPGDENRAALTFSPAASDRAANNGASAALAIISAESKTLPASGFAPGVFTQLPSQPLDLRYTSYDDLWLEIPKLKVKTPIVGIPFKNGSWDVTWLGANVGWLNGTAFPTWEGNSVLTAHVYQSDGAPGPFISLDQLKWGDQLVIHAYGQKYTYEIRSVDLVRPWDASPLEHKDQSWLTLITCKDYSESQKAYQWRVAVQAILLKITPDK